MSAQGAPKRAGNAKGKGGGGQRYKSKRTVGGRGIFVTCIRGKEQRSQAEFMDLLDEVADRIYPADRLAELALLRAHRTAQPDAQTANPEGMDEDEASSEEEDESIEASIARELAELQSAGKKRKAPQPGKPKGPKPRFQSVETSTECMLFIATAWPYDPVELTEAIVREIQETAVSHTRYTQRLSPIAISCHALNSEQVDREAAAYIEKYFAEYSERTGKTEITYQIEPTIRCHEKPLSRSTLLASLGASVRALSEPPSPSSPFPTRPALTLSANLTTPDLVLLPTVFRSCFGLSIVEGKDWSGKTGRKFNLDQVAAEARKIRMEREGETMVRGMEGVEKKVVEPVVEKVQEEKLEVQADV
ncbi:hypothetical protein BCR35DRAFT_351747 [Leucosporidium creatinivorum]|uniref:THUMP domain-containing protein n=1 Tax=Leucosporidium creatinivorum TaxID=106004 RepID=A0A1Y2FN39_9BASI|nr:hypothetical protein BCR35DRAFT_351747 [Leucosporidium creatinivorum]